MTDREAMKLALEKCEWGFMEDAANILRQALAQPEPVVSFTDNEEGLCIQLECNGSYYWQNLSDFDAAKFFVKAYRGKK